MLSVHARHLESGKPTIFSGATPYSIAAHHALKIIWHVLTAATKGDEAIMKDSE